ncbi:hypothetical protein GGI11_002164 [Coemansia sp. RSA 2049]|nr:hypothetical protein H4217_005532 [Coemansia sp. RSA 1939]KAJ2520908.1 hypothetical protein GGI11_002164 [Coemansia sp. RSA 2049]KAJ2611933.1 hypothetical protein EV177_003248 [Coemansia sp. RSA 1804]KAJ2684173.1 hypothetical protein GGH99_004134 [Coemansia sp. RSA 1285]
MDREIREYPVDSPGPVSIVSYPRVVREKVLHDIDMYIRQREYGKASELLLAVVENNGSIGLHEMWWLLLASVRVQGEADSLGHYLDNIVFELKGRKPPHAAAMERVFGEIERGRMESAYAVLVSLAQEHGSKLALAHGYLGILVACLRETEIRRLRRTRGDVDVRPAAPSVFGFAGSSNDFCISAEATGGRQYSRYTLRDAESHLSQAVRLDPESELFRPFHAQVLVALGRLQAARELADRWYARNRSVPSLRLLLSLGQPESRRQEKLVLEYLELDPFAPAAEVLCSFMDRVLSNIGDAVPAGSERRILSMLVGRIEGGNDSDAFVWKYLVLFVTCLRKQERHDVLDSVMGPRLPWWETTYFSPHVFNLSKLSELLVCRAVCAKQLLAGIPSQHPAIDIFYNDRLSRRQLAFVLEHVDLPP